MPAKPAPPPEDPAPLAIPGEYAVVLEDWAAQNATRTDARGDPVAAVELMGGFVYRMRQAGRHADYPSNYRRDWLAFLAS